MYSMKVTSEVVDDSREEEILLDPDHVLCVFTTLDVMDQYSVLIESGQDELNTDELPENFTDLPRELQLTMIREAAKVFEDSSHELDSITENLRDNLTEHLGKSRG